MELWARLQELSWMPMMPGSKCCKLTLKLRYGSVNLNDPTRQFGKPKRRLFLTEDQSSTTLTEAPEKVSGASEVTSEAPEFRSADMRNSDKLRNSDADKFGIPEARAQPAIYVIIRAYLYTHVPHGADA